MGPIGHHRRSHIKPSRGKRAAKREKKAKAKNAQPERAKEPVATPLKPELCASIDVGFNSISRKLETFSKTTNGPNSSDPKDSAKPYTMVFVSRGNQTSTFNCHFPQMVGAATKNCSLDDKTRLIGFSRPVSDRISNSLGVLRVSSIAITKDAPGAEALWAFVKKAVPPIEVPWICGKDVHYKTTKINSIETTVGEKRVRLV